MKSQFLFGCLPNFKKHIQHRHILIDSPIYSKKAFLKSQYRPSTPLPIRKSLSIDSLESSDTQGDTDHEIDIYSDDIPQVFEGPTELYYAALYGTFMKKVNLKANVQAWKGIGDFFYKNYEESWRERVAKIGGNIHDQYVAKTDLGGPKPKLLNPNHPRVSAYHSGNYESPDVTGTYSPPRGIVQTYTNNDSSYYYYQYAEPEQVSDKNDQLIKESVLGKDAVVNTNGEQIILPNGGDNGDVDEVPKNGIEECKIAASMEIERWNSRIVENEFVDESTKSSQSSDLSQTTEYSTESDETTSQETTSRDSEEEVEDTETFAKKTIFDKFHKGLGDEYGTPYTEEMSASTRALFRAFYSKNG